MMIEQLKADYPVAQLCRVLDCPRSSYYARRQAHEAETEVVEQIEAILMRWPFYGYRRIVAQLKRQGIQLGERRVRALLKELDVSRQVGRVRVQTTDSQHAHGRYPNRLRGLDITAPDQVWVGDITYIRLGRRFLYLAVIVDACTRAVRGWALSRSLAQEVALEALDMALAKATPFISILTRMCSMLPSPIPAACWRPR